MRLLPSSHVLVVIGVTALTVTGLTIISSMTRAGTPGREKDACYYIYDPCSDKDSSSVLCQVEFRKVSCDDPRCTIGNCKKSGSDGAAPPPQPPPPENPPPVPVPSPSPSPSAPPPVVLPPDGSREPPVLSPPPATKPPSRDQGKKEERAPEPSRDSLPGTVESLGCFAPDGTWTTDRRKCDRDQRSHLMPGLERGSEKPSETLSSADETRTITILEEKFVGDATKEERRRELLDIASSALQRMKVVAGDTQLSQNTQEYVKQTVEWLTTIINDYSFTERTLKDLTDTANAVRDTLAAAQTLIVNDKGGERDGLSASARMQTIVATMEDMLTKVPQALAIYDREKIAVPSDVRIALNEATALFGEVKIACREKRDSCSRMREVFTVFERVSQPMVSALYASGKEGAIKEVEAILGGSATSSAPQTPPPPPGMHQINGVADCEKLHSQGLMSDADLEKCKAIFGR